MDSLPVAISIVALLVSLWATRVTVKTSKEIAEAASSESRRLALEMHDRGVMQQKEAAYERLHEAMVDVRAARGRKLLFLWSRNPGEDVDPANSAWDEINYSLALYDTLGGYIYWGLIPQEMVLRTWHHPLRNIALPARRFVELRQRMGILQPWSYLGHLIDMAENYECVCPASSLNHVPEHSTGSEKSTHE